MNYKHYGLMRPSMKFANEKIKMIVNTQYCAYTEVTKFSRIHKFIYYPTRFGTYSYFIDQMKYSINMITILKAMINEQNKRET